MILEAIVLGAIESAIYREGDKLRAIRIGPDGENAIDCSQHISLLLDCASEQRRLKLQEPTLDKLTELLRVWSANHRALSMAIAGVDTDLSAETRRSCILESETLMATPGVARFARARL